MKQRNLGILLAGVLITLSACSAQPPAPQADDATPPPSQAGGTDAVAPQDPPEEDNTVQTLTPEEAKARMEEGGVIILDVRTQEEYNEAHIPGAILAPNESISEEASAILPDKDAPVLVYCRSGRRSAEASEKLAALGYTQVFDFGGIQDWPYETVTE